MIILFSGAKIVKNERINKFRAAKCFRQWKKICLHLHNSKAEVKINNKKRIFNLRF